MTLHEMRRQLTAYNAQGGNIGQCAAIGLKACAEIERQAKEIARLSQMTLFGDVKPPPKTPIGT